MKRNCHMRTTIKFKHRGIECEHPTVVSCSIVIHVSGPGCQRQRATPFERRQRGSLCLHGAAGDGVVK